MDDPSAFTNFQGAVGWIPAVIFPTATIVQIFALVHRRDSKGVSAISWALFALANICLYVTVGEWTRPQLVISTLGSALLQVVVVALIVRLRRPALSGK